MHLNLCLRACAYFAAALALSFWAPDVRAADPPIHQPWLIEYYRVLAEEGSADAQLTLGDVYAHGSGVAKDLVEAYAWYYLAAQQGIEEAVKPMNAALRGLPKSDWERARQRAEAYESRILSKVR